MLSHVSPWTSARQTPLAEEWNCWSGLPFPSPQTFINKNEIKNGSQTWILNKTVKLLEENRKKMCDLGLGKEFFGSVQFGLVAQSCPTLILWTTACQASSSITNSWSLLKLMSIELVMPSNHLILCCSLLLPPSIFPSFRVFSNESVLHIRWPKYQSFSFSISPSNEYSGPISFRMDWLEYQTTWPASWEICMQV